jgi:hypothetical protein
MSSGENRHTGNIDDYFEAERQTTDFVIRDRHWADEAACRDADGDEFYGSARGDPRHLRERYCLGCPVRHDCLVEGVIKNDMSAMVLGGLVRSERRVLRKLYNEQQGVKPHQRRLNLHDEGIISSFLIDHFEQRNA